MAGAEHSWISAGKRQFVVNRAYPNAVKKVFRKICHRAQDHRAQDHRPLPMAAVTTIAAGLIDEGVSTG